MRLSRGWILGSIGGLIAAGAAALFVQSCDLRQRTVFTDGASIRRPMAGAPIREMLWTPPQALPPSINGHGDVYEAKFSADALTMVFVRGQPGGHADIFIAQRSEPDEDAWGQAQPLSEVNTGRDELGPELSPDGRRLYFYSDRAGGHGGYDLWMSEQRGSSQRGWGAPVNLGPSVNSPFHEYSPALSADGSELYFASNRPRAGDFVGTPSQSWAATLRAGAEGRTFDLYAAPLRGGGLDHAVAVDALNSPYDEGAPAFSPAGDFIYFASNRPNGLGGFDLYRSRLLRGRFLAPTNIGAPVNTVDNELDPGLANDGFALGFSSDRPLIDTAASPSVDAGPPAAQYKLYSSRSREVFQEIDAAGAGIDWAGLWHKLWPSLLWLLLALLGLLALLALLRGVQSRRLSLLARCVLASLLVHAMIMFLLSFWQVTTSIAGLLNRGEMKVAITSASAGESLQAQIRGSLTHWSPSAVADAVTPAEPAVEAPSLERVDVPAEHAPVSVAIDASPSTPVHDAAAPPIEHAVAPLQQPALAAIDAAVDLPQASAAPAVAEAALTMSQQDATAYPPTTPAAVLSHATRAAAVEPLSRELSVVEAPRRDVDGHATPLPESTVAANAAPIAHLPAVATAATDSVNLPPSDLPPVTQEPSRHVQAQPSKPSRAAADVSSTMNTAAALRPVEAAKLPLAASPPTNRPAPADVRDSTPANAPAVAQAPPTLAAPPREPMAIAAALPREAPATQPDELQAAPLSPVLPAARPVELSTTHAQLPAPHSERLEPSAIQWRQPVARPLEVAASPDLPSPDHQTPKNATQVPQLSATVSQELALPLERTAPGEPRTPDRDAPPVLARVSPVRVAASPSDAPADPVELRQVQPTVVKLPEPAPDDRTDLAGLVDAAAPVGEPLNRRSLAAAAPDLSRFSLPTPVESDLRLPLETEPPPNPYAQRAPEKREQFLEERGGSEETERAVARALQWLAAHQGTDGRWSSRQFDQGCGSCAGAARYDADVAITGLALLCFLGADHTHVKPGPYQDAVRRGVRWLAGRQKPNGDLRGDETMYSHGIATIALSEAYGMTRDETLLAAVQNAVNFIASARNARMGGWRYEPGQAGDTSVLGWQIMAMVSAKRAGLDVAADALDAGRQWLDRVAAEPGRGLYAYQPGQRYTHAMTAEGMFVLQLLGASRSEARMRESAEFISAEVPRWQGEANTYYWYYGTLAMFQHQGEPWRRWNAALKEHLLANQRLSGPAAGSWDPADNWSRIGGRIYQTAMCTLSLEVYYRYLPLYTVFEPEAEE